MTDPMAEVERKRMELLRQINETLNDIIDLMRDVKAAALPPTTYGVAVMIQGSSSPMIVPDDWIKEWVTMCNGSTEFVLSELRKAAQWNLDNPSRRKTVRGLRSHLGKWIFRAWEREGLHRPKATGSLAGHEKRNRD